MYIHTYRHVLGMYSGVVSYLMEENFSFQANFDAKFFVIGPYFGKIESRTRNLIKKKGNSITYRKFEV